MALFWFCAAKLVSPSGATWRRRSSDCAARLVLFGAPLPIARRLVRPRLFRLRGKTGAVPLFRLRHKTGGIRGRADADSVPASGRCEQPTARGLDGFVLRACRVAWLTGATRGGG